MSVLQHRRAGGDPRRLRRTALAHSLWVQLLSGRYGAEQSVRLAIYPVSEVKRVGIAIQERAVKNYLSPIDPDLGQRVARGLGLLILANP